MPSFRIIFFLAGLAAAYLYLDRTDDVRLVKANGDYSYEGYDITSLEPFELTGRVLSTKDYRTGREAELSPTDLAMGWGEMQQAEHVAALKVSQRNRWMYWTAQTLPIPMARLKSQMANIHIIPANEEVATALKQVDADAIVRLQGDLVAALGTDGWRWRSSLSRTDTGDGSCELLWLKKLTQLN